MRKLTTLLAAAAIAVVVAACQLLPFTPSNEGSDGQSPGAAQSPGAETFAPTTDPIETVPASPDGDPSTDDPGPSPSIEIPPPID